MPSRRTSEVESAGLTGPLVLRGLLDGSSAVDAREFVPFRPGVEISPIYGMTAAGEPVAPDAPAAAFLRYAPGAEVPHHEHGGYEHIIVLEGSQHDARGRYVRGTCLVSPPGSSHSVASDDGCLVLAIWNRPVVMTSENQP